MNIFTIFVHNKQVEILNCWFENICSPIFIHLLRMKNYFLGIPRNLIKAIQNDVLHFLQHMNDEIQLTFQPDVIYIMSFSRNLRLISS